MLTAGFFGAAVVPSLVVVARGTPVLAALLAVLWLVLLPALLWEGHVEGTAALAALLTLLLAGPVSRVLAGAAGWPHSLAAVVLVELVMATLALVNQLLRLRRRSRPNT